MPDLVRLWVTVKQQKRRPVAALHAEEFDARGVDGERLVVFERHGVNVRMAGKAL
jgi:hypothetical protein